MSLNGNMAVTMMTATDDSGLLQTIDLEAGPGVAAFFTLRGIDSVVNDPYSGFNVCHYSGDSTEHVAACRHKLATKVGLSVDKLIIPHQTHSANVAIIENIPVEPIEETDALVTRRDDCLICINTADCLPIVFNDPENRVIGIAHAGWRGLKGHIISATIAAMRTLGSMPDKIHAAIGPCIFCDCYEVDSPFATKFSASYPHEINLVHPSTVTGKRHLDLPAAAIYQLKLAGLQTEMITKPPLCTRCNSGILFSARALGVTSGRILTAIRLL